MPRTVTTSNGTHIEILYVEFTGLEDGKIFLTCSNWRNPLVAKLYDNVRHHPYKIRSWDFDYTLLVQSKMAIDASDFADVPIRDESFQYALTDYHRGDFTNMTISFVADTPITSGNGCFVKYTFPDEIGLSMINISETKATGMFSNA